MSKLFDRGHHVPLSRPAEIRVMTLNCWGLKFISKMRQPRLAEIGRQIAQQSPPPQIVGLQECWTQEDYLAIREATAHILPYAKFYYGGVFGAGLAILSFWPIEESSMTMYPLNGRPSAFWRGDWYVGKGIARASIRIGPGEKDIVQVFNTHTHAPYGTAPGSQYTAHRTAQAWLIAQHLRAAASCGHLVIALGDYNMIPSSLAHRIITSQSPVRDVWRVIHPNSSLGPANHATEAARGVPIPTAEYNLLVNGCTSDGPYNTWRWNKPQQNRLKKGDPCPVDPNTPDPKGKRLDYIFASTGPDATCSGRGWVVDTVSVGMTGRHPELQVSLSDHFAVYASIKYHDITTDVPNLSFKAQLEYNVKSEDGLSSATYNEILEMIKDYVSGEQAQQRWRSWHFYLSLLVWVATTVAISFTGRFGILLSIIGSLVLVSGVIDGLIALLFFSSELRNLREFEWEIQNAKEALDY